MVRWINLQSDLLVQGEIDGQGEQHEPNGQVYVGEFKNGQFHGEGHYYGLKEIFISGTLIKALLIALDTLILRITLSTKECEDYWCHGIGELTMANGRDKGSLWMGKKSGFWTLHFLE